MNNLNVAYRIPAPLPEPDPDLPDRLRRARPFLSPAPPGSAAERRNEAALRALGFADPVEAAIDAHAARLHDVARGFLARALAVAEDDRALDRAARAGLLVSGGLDVLCDHLLRCDRPWGTGAIRHTLFWFGGRDRRRDVLLWEAREEIADELRRVGKGHPDGPVRSLGYPGVVRDHLFGDELARRRGELVLDANPIELAQWVDTWLYDKPSDGV